MSKSDHDTTSRTNIFELLPEVHRSEINESIFEAAYNRHLTKDDAEHVSGYIGQRSANVVNDRQLPEPTPHRQAFQLQPTMHTSIGDSEYVISFKSFQKQLELMGVDFNDMDEWGNALQFNWVPPVNIDMLVNYSNYYWGDAQSAESTPQYLTIENRCHKQRSVLNAYNKLLSVFGEYFAIVSIDLINNSVSIAGKSDALFAPRFQFFIADSTDVNLQDRYVIVSSAMYDAIADTTTLFLDESSSSLSIRSVTAPATNIIGRYWTNTHTNEAFVWDGASWTPAIIQASGAVSLSEMQSTLLRATNCACNADYGWDLSLWDNGNGDWIRPSLDEPTSPVPGNLWLDLQTDTLKAYDGEWVTVSTNWSRIPSNDDVAWDFSPACPPQEPNPWSTSNRWTHKTQLTSFVGVARAQLPIFEYDSNAELNKWAHTVYRWKYRSQPYGSFSSIGASPSRLELAPITEYVYRDGKLYLYNPHGSTAVDVDYTTVFTPGFKFVLTKSNANVVCEVTSSVFREMTASDGPLYAGHPHTSRLATVVTLADAWPVSFAQSQPLNGQSDVAIVPYLTTAGDTWRGYHAHWLYVDQSTAPTAAQPENALLARAKRFPAEYVSLREYRDVNSIYATGEVGPYYQLWSLLHAHTTFNFDDDLKVVFRDVMPETGSVRVYVNGIRQYGTYLEQTSDADRPYPYVVGIVFDAPLQPHDTVRIEIGAASIHDVGLTALPVRTIADDDAFAVHGETYMCLAPFNKHEQSKSAINQYPMFNVYDLCTNEVVKVSSIFEFVEDPSQPVNTAIQKRIVVSDNGREFHFNQTLLEADDGRLYGYRLNNGRVSVNAFWYNPGTERLQTWDGTAWQSTIASNDDYRNITMLALTAGEVEPASSTDGTVWFDTTADVLKTYRNGSWIVLPSSVLVENTDPTLTSIWRGVDQYDKNSDGPAHTWLAGAYVPQYVDSDRSPIKKGHPDGDWEVPAQWRYNTEHTNRRRVKYSDVVTHFQSIINAQPAESSFIGGGISSKLQSEYQYWLGGTIKEHNDSYDTLMSAVNVTNVTPLTVIEFARDQYADSLLLLRDLFFRHAGEIFSDASPSTVLNHAHAIASAVIARYENNDFVGTVYSDTLAFDDVTGKGVRRWITTLPMIGLSHKTLPSINIDRKLDLYEVVHHDGHRSMVRLTPAERDTLSRLVCNAIDPRLSAVTMGSIGAGSPPATMSTFLSTYGSIRPGMYWYDQTTSHKLYRFEIVAASSSHPAELEGQPVPNGAYYLNVTNNTLYVSDDGAWTAAAPSGTLTAAWKVVDLREMLARVVLTVEQRLYDVTPSHRDLAFDVSHLQHNADQRSKYLARQRDRYKNYLSTNNIAGSTENVTYDPSNAFTWNYSNSNVTVAPTTSVGKPAASWRQLYTNWFNTPYPHLEPWKLLNHDDKPSWWDATYKDVTGSRRWKAAMWSDVRDLGGYLYVPVNTTSSVIIGNYQPDDLLPPYYPGTSTNARSLFTDLSQISAPAAGFKYGDGSEAEWKWLTSGFHVYDDALISFKMQPVRFTAAAFGVPHTRVNNLQVSTELCKVYSHRDALFHGDIYDTNVVYRSRGINQWYVNFNRYRGYDTNRDFRLAWSHWKPRMTYQMSGIADTDTFDISNKFFDIVPQDYDIVLTSAGVLNDTWVDGFNVSLLYVPPALVQYNNQAAWRFELDTMCPVTRSISYFGVRNYPFVVDTATNIATIFRFVVTAGLSQSRSFEIAGDHVDHFLEGTTVVVSQTSGSNGTYTVSSAVYYATTNTTKILVVEPVAVDVLDGVLDIPNRALPWSTSQVVFLSSSKLLPSPVVQEQDYYIIRVNDRQFKLAETINDSIQGLEINFITPGSGDLTIGQVRSSFNVFGGTSASSQLWYHYELDTSVVHTITPPVLVAGIQRLINIIDGCVEMQTHNRVTYGLSEAGDVDEVTGRPMSWQVETEKFIDWAHRIRGTRASISDRYDIEVYGELPTTTVKFTSMVPSWPSTTPITFNTTGTLPAPLLPNTQYYLIPTGEQNVYQVAVSPVGPNTAVTLSSVGSGVVTVSRYAHRDSFPSYEINPGRRNVWIETPQGITSNIVDGPYPDIRVQQTIFDQYGQPISSDKLIVYRSDKRTRIQLMGENQSVDSVHIGGAHVFVEGYEHVVLFNDYTVTGNLIYDQFIGLNAPRFNVDYYEMSNFTMRPSLGGYYLIGNEFKRNIEGQTSDMQLYYDAFRLPEHSPVAKYSRALLGYNGNMSFLDLLNTNAKSQFIFYRGMIQQKGSVHSVNAYINSRRFLDAKVDECWAYKVAEFGDSRPKIHPRLRLNTSDAYQSTVRFQFDAVASDVTIRDASFETVSLDQHSRLVEFPNQREQMRDSLLLLDANVINSVTITSLTAPGQTVYYKLPFVCDHVGVIPRNPQAPGTKPTLVNSGVLKIDRTYFNASGGLTVFAIVPGYDKLTPAHIIDVKSRQDITPVDMWDPARGYHTPAATHNVDVMIHVDPAVYSSTVVDHDRLHAWGPEREGTVWVDTTEMSYVPYYDSRVFSVEEQIANWGKLADWGSVKTYKWTKSTAHPTHHAARAISESVDLSIDQNEKITGTAKRTVYVRRRSLVTVSTAGSNITIPVSMSLPAVGTAVVFTSESLPSSLEANIHYYVVSVSTSARTIRISAQPGGSVITIGTHSLVMTTAFDGSWKRDRTIAVSLSAVADLGILTHRTSAVNLHVNCQPLNAPDSTTYMHDVTCMHPGDAVDVYVNGARRIEAAVVNANMVVAATLTLHPHDTVTVVRHAHLLTDADRNFAPTPDSDDASVTTQWMDEHEYSTRVSIADDGTQTVEYYYWVTGDTTYDSTKQDNLSIAAVERQLVVPPRPYAFMLSPRNVINAVDQTMSHGDHVTSSWFYHKLVVAGASNHITDDDRYALQLVRDLSMRTADVTESRKPKHTQWKLIRRAQPNNIDRELWTALTESIVGYKLDNPDLRVPSYERELYDAEHNTTTRFGLSPGQTFVDGKLALATILAYLEDPSINFYPIDVNAFFDMYSFDTPRDAAEAMEAIYATFNSIHVNAMWFDCLLDAMSCSSKYKEFFKTSWIALHGVRLLGVSGIFDD